MLQGRGGEDWGIDLAQALEASLVGSPAAGNAGLQHAAGQYSQLNDKHCLAVTLLALHWGDHFGSLPHSKDCSCPSTPEQTGAELHVTQSCILIPAVPCCCAIVCAVLRGFS